MSRRTLYAILSIGLIGTFLGHGAWAIGGKDTFIELLTGSVDHVFGATMSADTGEAIVRVIGGVDLVLAAAMTLMLVGALRGAGALHRFAYSNAALAVYSWAILWGFATAAARMTSVGEFFPEVWDLVERAPNWMLPAALAYLVVTTRKAHPEAPLFVPEGLTQVTTHPEPVR
jgi:hypothetical protein